MNKKNGLDLSGKMGVLVKFAFTNPKHIPAGIRETTMQDERRRKELAGRHLSRIEGDGIQVQEHRPGQVDTGIPVFQNVPGVHVACIRRGLVNNGFVLTDAHYFMKTAPGRTPKYMVVLVFERGAVQKELPRGTTDALIALANTVWAYAHVWSNPNATVTVNMVGRQPDVQPKNAISTRDGHLVVLPVTAIVEEGEEAA